MLQNLSSREKKFILALLAVAVAAVFYLFVLGPQLEEYIALSGELQQKQAELQKAETVLESQELEQKRAWEIKRIQSGYAPLFDTELRDGSALVQIGLKAAGLNVIINNLEPGSVIDRESHLELPLTVELQGEYEGIRELLSQIESLPNLTEIRTLKASAVGRDLGHPAEDVAAPLAVIASPLNLQCVLVVYSGRTPEGKLYLEQEIIQAWRVGRDNPFAIPARVSPHPNAPVAVPVSPPPLTEPTQKVDNQGEEAGPDIPPPDEGQI